MKTEEAEELDYVVIGEIEPEALRQSFLEYLSYLDPDYDNISFIVDGEHGKSTKRCYWEYFKKEMGITF